MRRVLDPDLQRRGSLGQRNFWAEARCKLHRSSPVSLANGSLLCSLIYLIHAMSLLFRTLAIVSLGVVLSSGTARASQVVFGNLGSDGSGGLSAGETSISGTQWVAQGFSTGSGSTNLFIDSIVLGLSVDSGSANTTVSIWSDSSSEPGSLLYSNSIPVAVATTTPTAFTFDLGGAALAANTSYWVVLQQPGVNWNFNSSFSTPTAQNTSGYTFSGGLLSTNSGGTWSSDVGAGFSSISITASSTGPAPVPEPGTWAAAALLVGAAAYVGWRRRVRAA